MWFDPAPEVAEELPLKRLWQRLIKKDPAAPSSQTVLAEKYANFQRLLSANNAVLALMTDMEEKLSGDFLFDLQYIRANVGHLAQETATLVDALNNLGEQRYEGLVEAFRRIIAEVEDVLNQRREIQKGPLTRSFDELNLDLAEEVGGKNANLGEVKNRVGLPVPPGFAISTYAYKLFLDYNRLTTRIPEFLGVWGIDDLDSLAQVSDNLKSMINQAQVPPELEAAIQAAYEELCRQDPGSAPGGHAFQRRGRRPLPDLCRAVCHLPECARRRDGEPLQRYRRQPIYAPRPLLL